MRTIKGLLLVVFAMVMAMLPACEDSVTDSDVEWCDPTTDLCWQNPPSTEAFSWNEAVNYCNGLSLGGHDGWRLPKIQELISLLRGCVDGIATGDLSVSECGVGPDNLGCPSYEPACNSCDSASGPDDNPAGCYWDPALAGDCSWYWSSSSCANYADDAWVVGFNSAPVASGGKSGSSDDPAYTRCVRNQ